ncbi:MAG: NTP transferase domain-containing protein [Burkholderiales bacterium]
MRALILAAGRGKRLGAAEQQTPKCLLRFGGKTLLERHLNALRRCGIDDVSIAVGYRSDMIEAELATLGVHVGLTFNPDYQQGSMVTLWTLRDALGAGGDTLLMDADVLYHQRLLQRLVDSSHHNCFLIDRNIDPGDEPVRLCIRDGCPVEFRKKAQVDCDYYGESVGFFRLSAAAAQRLAEASGSYMKQGRVNEEYEEALRDVLLHDDSVSFGFEDVTGVPWIEIDFPEDVRRAELEVLPRLGDNEAVPSAR